MSVYDHLHDGERIELQHPPFYLTNRRLLRNDDATGAFSEVPRIGMTAVERIHVTDHRIMVLGVIMVVSGAILTLTWAPYTAWLAIIVGLAALLMGVEGQARRAPGRLGAHPGVAARAVAAPGLGRRQLRQPAAHHRRREPAARPGVVAPLSHGILAVAAKVLRPQARRCTFNGHFRA